jgi:hypothetical protein
MAYEASQPLKDGQQTADADLRAHQYKFVKLTSTGVAAIAAVTDVPYGVLQNKPNTGQECEIVVVGVTKVQADEALVKGNLIATSSDGQAQVVVPGTETTVYIVGQVLKAAGAAGRIATAAVNCVAPSRAA